MGLRGRVQAVGQGAPGAWQVFEAVVFYMAKQSGIDSEYKLALGSLVIEVSKLDSKMTDLIGALTGMDTAYALILVHHQQFANKWDGLCALFRIIYPDDDDPQYRPVKDVLTRTKAVADFRNSVVHALWHVDAAGVPHTVRFQARGKLTRSRQPAPVEKLRQYALEAIELGGNLSALAQVYREYRKIGPQS